MADMITIACKAPNGVVLNLDRYEMVGVNGVVRRMDGAASFALRGWSRPWGSPDTTIGGYGLTEVPREFWDAWLASHADFPMLADKTIIVHAKDTAGAARGHAAVEQMFRPARKDDIKGVSPLIKDEAA